MSVPEELELVWDDKVAEAFAALVPKQQSFLIEYLKSWNGSDAYRKAYNPLARDEVASANASRLIASDKVGVILARFQERKTEALFTVARTYFDMNQATKPEWVETKDGTWENVGDVPDWKARKDGADGLCKVYGLNAAEKKEITGSLIIQSTPTDENL